MSEKVIPSVGDEHENDLEKDVTADVPISREFVARVTSIKIMKPGLASSLVKEEPKAKEIDATVEHSKYLTHLPRGGTIVATPQGDIQFGIPPETIKVIILVLPSSPCVFATLIHTIMRPTPTIIQLYSTQLNPTQPNLHRTQ